MSDLQYARVNASTATSQVRYNARGEKFGEIYLELPNNILDVGDTIVNARMAVMKMQVPLAKVPVAEMEIESNAGNELNLAGLCSVLPVSYRDGVWADPPSHLRNYFLGRDFIVSVPMQVPAHDPEEMGRGYHDFLSVGEFLNSLSDCMDEAVIINGNRGVGAGNVIIPPKARFICNTDNTISLKMTPGYALITDSLSATNEVRDFPLPWCAGTAIWASDHAATVADPDPTSPVVYNVDGSVITAIPQGFFYVFNEALARKFPSLPFIKVKNDPTTPHYLTMWHEPDLYLLDTTSPVFSLQQNAIQYSAHEGGGGGRSTRSVDVVMDAEERRAGPSRAYAEGNLGVNQYFAVSSQVEPSPPDPTPAPLEYRTLSMPEFTYHFTDSDAVTISSVRSICLTMTGGNFNQQVFPVNVTPSQLAAAQTTNIPILEVYYPVWSRPSDMTTDMIISRESFSNAAPIEISPYLLRERTLTFKLFYITSKGEKREMLIPDESPFTFQICFELKLRRA